MLIKLTRKVAVGGGGVGGEPHLECGQHLKRWVQVTGQVGVLVVHVPRDRINLIYIYRIYTERIRKMCTDIITVFLKDTAVPPHAPHLMHSTPHAPHLMHMLVPPMHRNNYSLS